MPFLCTSTYRTGDTGVLTYLCISYTSCSSIIDNIDYIVYIIYDGSINIIVMVIRSYFLRIFDFVYLALSKTCNDSC